MSFKYCFIVSILQYKSHYFYHRNDDVDIDVVSNEMRVVGSLPYIYKSQPLHKKHFQFWFFFSLFIKVFKEKCSFKERVLRLCLHVVKIIVYSVLQVILYAYIMIEMGKKCGSSFVLNKYTIVWLTIVFVYLTIFIVQEIIFIVYLTTFIIYVTIFIVYFTILTVHVTIFIVYLIIFMNYVIIFIVDVTIFSSYKTYHSNVFLCR